MVILSYSLLNGPRYYEIDTHTSRAVLVDSSEISCQLQGMTCSKPSHKRLVLGEWMTSARLDGEVEAFISSCINSVEQLEILLMLRAKTGIDSDWITNELRTSATSIEKRLNDLMRINLIVSRLTDGVRLFYFEPPQNYVSTIDHLAALYISHRVTIINAIFSKPPNALKDFSEAFRFKE